MNATHTRLAQFRSVALPVEHGGWGFLLEPIVLGLLVAPSPAGALLGLAALAVFLARHPLEIWGRDFLAHKRFPRTQLALQCSLAYGGCGIAALSAAAWLTQAPFWPALLVALPLALVQVIADLQKRSRQLLAELAGAVALAGLAPAIALAQGWPLAAAFGLMGILAIRDITSIIYVRARVRRVRGQAVSSTPAITVQFAGLAATALLVWLQLLPWPALIAMCFLLARVLFVLLRPETASSAKIVGFQEMAVGIMVIGLTALGYLR